MKEKKNSSPKKGKTTKEVNTPKAKTSSSTKQNVILVGLILVILICVFFSIKTILKSKENTELEVNDSDAIHKEVLKDAKVGVLTITDAKLTVDDGITTYMAVVTNDSDSEYYVNVLYITFTNGNATHKMPVLSDVTIAPHETELITSNLDSDISDTTKIDYELK